MHSTIRLSAHINVWPLVNIFYVSRDKVMWCVCQSFTKKMTAQLKAVLHFLVIVFYRDISLGATESSFMMHFCTLAYKKKWGKQLVLLNLNRLSAIFLTRNWTNITTAEGHFSANMQDQGFGSLLLELDIYGYLYTLEYSKEELPLIWGEEEEDAVSANNKPLPWWQWGA